MEEQEKAPDTPVTTGTDESQPEKQETPVVDPRYAGKSPADLVNILGEKEKQIGKLGDEVGKYRSLESEVSALKDYIYNLALQREPVKEPEVTKPAFDYTNPDAYIESRVATIKGELIREYQAQEGRKAQAEAQIAFQSGKREAYQGNKELFDGIERDVEGFLWNQARTGQIHPRLLGDKNTWVNIAQGIRLMRGETDLLIPKKTQPMRAADMETPGRVKRDVEDGDVYLDEEERELAKSLGISDKEALEILRSENKQRTTGASRRPKK